MTLYLIFREQLIYNTKVSLHRTMVVVLNNAICIGNDNEFISQQYYLHDVNTMGMNHTCISMYESYPDAY